MIVVNLPGLNALLNAIAATFLVAGWFAIKKRGNMRAHRTFMLLALLSSTLFLASYTYYHYNAGAITRYEGGGRWFYLAILFTHIPLAGLMPPFILAAVWFAMRGRFDIHTRITRWLWPVWIYVSVTGVLIYLMLYVL